MKKMVAALLRPHKKKDHLRVKQTLSDFSMMAIIGLQRFVSRTVLLSLRRSRRVTVRRTGFQLQQKLIFPSQRSLMCEFKRSCHSTPPDDVTYSMTSFGSCTYQKLSKTPPSKVFGVHSTALAAAGNETPPFCNAYKTYKSVLFKLKHSGHTSANQKHSVPPGFCPRSGPHSSPRLGANTSSGDCPTYKVQKYMKPVT